MTSVFTYGSLMCSDIMLRVTGCQVAGIPAILKGYQRSRLRGEEYPGIIAHPDDEVAGILYPNLPPPAIERLDIFEGEQYLRQEIEVLTSDSGPCRAMAYVLHPRFTHLLTGAPWSYTDFLETGKARFLQAYIGFHKI